MGAPCCFLPDVVGEHGIAATGVVGLAVERVEVDG
jgi:hypothetical protein